jgi:hypothetical protein
MDTPQAQQLTVASAATALSASSPALAAAALGRLLGNFL